MVKKFRVALALQPIVVAALFANSPFCGGQIQWVPQLSQL